MLVRFFKDGNDLEVKCQVIKYTDRIWIESSGEALVFKQFVVEVFPNSPPLREIRMLIPRTVIDHPEDLNYTWSDRNYQFNKRFQGGKFNISRLARGEQPGIINLDGIQNVKYFSTP